MSRPVAGVAMGLILESDGRYAVLTDIMGSEDALGDMDFKVAGDEETLTAFQMDIKVCAICTACTAWGDEEAPITLWFKPMRICIGNACCVGVYMLYSSCQSQGKECFADPVQMHACMHRCTDLGPPHHHHLVHACRRDPPMHACMRV